MTNSKSNYRLLQTLSRLGLVRFIQLTLRSRLQAFPIYSKIYKTARVSCLKFFSKEPKPVSLRALRILHRYAPTTRLVLATSKGLITSSEALALKIGGVLFLRLT